MQTSKHDYPPSAAIDSASNATMTDLKHAFGGRTPASLAFDSIIHSGPTRESNDCPRIQPHNWSPR